MLARLSLASGCVVALLLASPGRADDGPFGDLDFSRLSKPQEQFFWKRLKSLAVEEAVLTYCDQPDDFEQQAKQGIRSCVTSEALNKAESFFKFELKAAKDGLGARQASCRAKPEATSGWLGVDIGPVWKDAADSPGARAGSGALVAGALDDSPAAAADLRAGDVITTVNGDAVAGPKELSAKIRALAPGATVQLGVLRDGAGRTVSVKLGAMAFDKQGRVALDMPALVESSKQDLKSVSDQVTEMCQKCKTSIWAMFCH
jgi:PDZ domain